MYDLFDSIKPFFLVSLGAILGSCMRVYVVDCLGSIFFYKHWGTFCVNIASAFVIGLFAADQSYLVDDATAQSSPISLLICIGFLGSVSTFSTFINELLTTLLKHNWKQFFSLSLFSLIGGFIAVAAGLILGNA